MVGRRQAWFHARSVLGHRRVDGLNQDVFCKFFTDSEARVAHQTDQVGVPAQEANSLLFAETHLPEAVGRFRSRRQLFDAYQRTHPHLVQRTGRWPGARTALQSVCLGRFTHGGNLRDEEPADKGVYERDERAT